MNPESRIHLNWNLKTRVTGPMNRSDGARETDLRRSPSSRALATRSSNSKTISDPATDDGTPAIQIETGICGNHYQEDRDRKPDQLDRSGDTDQTRSPRLGITRRAATTEADDRYGICEHRKAEATRNQKNQIKSRKRDFDLNESR
jgi:hypothetical protein